MTEVKMELVGSAPPVPPQGGISGFSIMPCAPAHGYDRTGMEPPQQTTERGGLPTAGMDIGGMGQMSKSIGGAISAMMPTLTAADMMLPRVVSPSVDDASADPRIHKELNEIIGKKQQQELHVQVPPLTKGPLVPSPQGMNGIKPGTPQVGGMGKPVGGNRSGGSTPQARTGTRGAGARANVSRTIEDACQAAAIEDGVLAGGRPDPPVKASKAKNGLRRGKWTPEEESYANRLIVEFKAGLLPLTDGTTLRTFLSKLLNCDPMRISKKFVGQNCIGKQVFRRRQVDMDRLTNDDIERSRQELADLERKFLERVAQTNRCKNSSGISKLTGGKDMGMGQVAPEVNRRTQEYASVGGRNVQNPIIPPWMLPPVSGGAGGSGAPGGPASANTSGSNTPVPSNAPPVAQGSTNGGVMMGWENGAKPPTQGRGAQGMMQGSGGMRRSGSDNESMTGASTPSLSPTGTSGLLVPSMPRNDSTDSLFQQVAEGITPLSDYPRNSSIGDLASLGIFACSPFQSTENLLGLTNPSNTSPISPTTGPPTSSSTASCSTNGSNNAPPPSFVPGPPQNGPQRSVSGGEWGSEFAANGHAQQGGYYDGSTAAGPAQVPHQNDAMAPRSGPASFPRPGEGLPTQTQQQQLQQQEQRTMPRVESSTGLTSLRVQGGMPRHGSVEDFLSLVACGDIPAPETNILSTSVFSGHAHQRPAAQAAMLAQQQQRAAALAGGGGPTGGSGPYGNFPQPAVIQFSGIGKPSGVPVGFPSQVQVGSMDVVQQGGAKRPRLQGTQAATHGGVGVTQQADGAVESGVRLKQPKLEGPMY